MYRILLIVLLTLSSVALAQAQDTTTEDDSSTSTDTVSSACNPVELNWCYAGQPWGDGRCNSSDPDETAYYYLEGFYRAVEACNAPASSSSATFTDEDGAFSIGCSANLRDDKIITLSANWSRRIRTQSRVVFRFDVTLLDRDLDLNNGESVGIGSFDTSASASRTYLTSIELKTATAYLIDGFDQPLTSPFNCSING